MDIVGYFGWFSCWVLKNDDSDELRMKVTGVLDGKLIQLQDMSHAGVYVTLGSVQLIRLNIVYIDAFGIQP